MTSVFSKQMLKKIQSKMFSSIEHRMIGLESRLDAIHQQGQARSRAVMSYRGKDNEIVTSLTNGLVMYLDVTDIAVVPHIVFNGVWEKDISKVWSKISRESRTIFDLGANFGYFGLIAAYEKKQAGIEDGRTILFEANPNLIPYIEKTLSVNWLNEGTTVENLAVSDKSGAINLNILQDYIGVSSVHDKTRLNSYLGHKMKVNFSETVSVECSTIDEYCRRNKVEEIDLLKMDIEGYEQVAYEGMRGMVSKSPSMTMFIEFTRDAYANPKSFYNRLLKDFGNVYAISPEGHLVKPRKATYEAVAVGDDWVMLVFSKRRLT